MESQRLAARLQPRGSRRAFAVFAAFAIFAVFAIVLVARLGGPRPSAARAVIPAGREGAVMAMLGDDAKSFAGVPTETVRLSGDAIVLVLTASPGLATCEELGLRAPGFVRIAPTPPPAGLAEGARRVGPLHVSYRACGLDRSQAEVAAGALASHLAARSHDGIWLAAEGSPFAPGGLLSPTLAALDVSPCVLVASVMTLVALLAAWLGLRAPAPDCAPDSAPQNERRARPWTSRPLLGLALAIVAIGLALRVHAARTMPLDVDEVWALASPHPVLSHDHDAWVHPPLFRALQQGWAAAIGFREGDSLLRLRAPSLLASAATLLALAFAAIRRARGFALALLPFAVAPAIVEASALARPYALATLALVVLAIALFPRPARARGDAWSIALLASTIALWTDLLAGLAAMLILALALTALTALTARAASVPRAARGRAWRWIGAYALAVAVTSAPLVPGALRASREQLLPESTVATSHGPDLRPRLGVRANAIAALAPAGDTRAPSTAAALGVAATLAFSSILALRARRVALAALPWALLGMLLVTGARVGLRTRNELFFPAIASFAAACSAAAARRPRA
jgi:hypothetical protein